MNQQWHSFLAGQGAAIDNGQVAHYGEPLQELKAASEGSILVDLSHLGLLELSGDDAAVFLQGQVTNDVQQLSGNNSQLAGYCTAKGRMLAIFLLWRREDKIYAQLDGKLTAPIQKRLSMYVLRSKVRIVDQSDSMARLGVSGTHAERTLQVLFGTLPQQAHDVVVHGETTLLRLPGAMPRFEIVATPETAASLWEQLASSCTPAGKSCWDWLDIHAGIPQVLPATQEAFVPQMLNLDLLGGISFKKGCYTGQEIVARTHYLGKVKRRTYLAHIDVSDTPQVGAPVFGAESAEAVGMIVSAAPAPSGGFDVLAEMREENAEAGKTSLASKDGPALALQALPYSG